MTDQPSAPPSRGARLSRFLARDTTGGILLLAATVLALIAANSPLADAYQALRDIRIGPAALHLDLSLATWAADGLLAIFFFVVGLELKHEFVAGSLRNPRTAALPIAAAVGGVALPAVVFTAIVAGSGGGDGALRGWAVPAATDIAFAVAVLALVGRRLPPALRTFLLTLAVVDDLIAITIIALFYSDGIDAVALALTLAPLAVFAVLVRRGVRAWFVLVPLAVVTWGLLHASGIHATIAGVALGLVVPAIPTTRAGVTHGTRRVALTEHFAEWWSPVSSGVAVPLFAFFAAGVSLGGLAGFGASLADPVAIGVAVALVVGKAVGITGTTLLVTRLPGLRLDPSLRWGDLVGLSFVAGIGFTVSLLIAELAYGDGTPLADHAKVGVLLGSVVAATLGGIILQARGRRAAAALAD